MSPGSVLTCWWVENGQILQKLPFLTMEANIEACHWKSFFFFFVTQPFFCWGTQTECVTYMLLQNKSPPWTNTFNTQIWRKVIGAQLSPFAPASVCLIALCTLSLSKPHTCGFVCPLMCAHVSAGVLSIRPHCWGSSFEDGKQQA